MGTDVRPEDDDVRESTSKNEKKVSDSAPGSKTNPSTTNTSANFQDDKLGKKGQKDNQRNNYLENSENVKKSISSNPSVSQNRSPVTSPEQKIEIEMEMEADYDADNSETDPPLDLERSREENLLKTS